MMQRLKASMRLPPCHGLDRSRYHQTAYRTLKIQKLVNMRPMKTAMQIWAGNRSRKISGHRNEGTSSPPTTSSTVLSSPHPRRKG